MSYSYFIRKISEGEPKDLLTIYLTTYELQKGEKKYQKEHQKGLQLLAQGLRELYALSLTEEIMAEEIEKKQHGKPFLKNHPDIHFNISHCEGLVVCVFSDAPVGVDVERIAEFKDSIVRKVLTKEEQEFLKFYKGTDEYNELFFRFWTLKESWLKQDGSGFFRSPQEISFALESNGQTFKVRCSDPNFFFHQCRVKGDCILSVCSTEQKEIENIDKKCFFDKMSEK